MNRLLVVVLSCLCTLPTAAQGPANSDHADSRNDRALPDRDGPQRPLTEQQVRQALELMQQVDPPMAARLRARFDEDPHAARRILQRRFPRLQWFLRLRERDPQLFERRVRQMKTRRQLLARYRHAQAEGRVEDIEKLRFELERAGGAGQDFDASPLRLPASDAFDPPGLGRGPDGHPRRVVGQPLTEAELAMALEVMEQIDPGAAAELRALHDEDVEAAGHMLQRQFPGIKRFLQLRDGDPQMFELRIKQVRLTRAVRGLVARFQRARDEQNPQDIQEIRSELTDVLGQMFDLRHSVRQRHLQRLERQLNELREELQREAAGKEQVVQHRLERLTEDRPHDSFERNVEQLDTQLRRMGQD